MLSAVHAPNVVFE